jgi:hypothetical protein
MDRTDAEIIAFLNSTGRAWGEYFVVSGRAVASLDATGRLFALLIEDDELYAQVKGFLQRHGKVRDREEGEK